jgi:hypothetical protein
MCDGAASASTAQSPRAAAHRPASSEAAHCSRKGSRPVQRPVGNSLRASAAAASCTARRVGALGSAPAVQRHSTRRRADASGQRVCSTGAPSAEQSCGAPHLGGAAASTTHIHHDVQDCIGLGGGAHHSRCALAALSKPRLPAWLVLTPRRPSATASAVPPPSGGRALRWRDTSSISD